MWWWLLSYGKITPMLGEKIIEKGQSLGFNVVGFVDGLELEDDGRALQQRAEQGLLSPFLGKDGAARANPAAFFPQVQTIILVAIAYNGAYTAAQMGQLKGRIAASGTGRDYHLELGERLEQLGQWLQRDVYENIQYRLFVDNQPILERALFNKAGLGFFGKNCTLIIPGQGSFFWLGGLATNIPIQELKLHETKQLGHVEKCGACSRCIEACPTGALEPYGLNPHKCIAQLTQDKGFIDRQHRAHFGSYLYGCDICQQACPHNVGNHDLTVRDEADDSLRDLDLIRILSMSNKEFKDEFGHTAFSWRGKTVLQRNAIIALANQGATSALAVLEELLKDQRPVIRGTTAWALGVLGEEKSANPLMIALKNEQDASVIEEMQWALQQLDNRN